MDEFAHNLLAWFDHSGRHDLPWQKDISPYRVWVSEIMLQQTRVDTVIPYFQRFMQSFPDLSSLAAAGEDQVLYHWTGLGYYARARNLHAAAKILVRDFQGDWPDSLEELVSLPGIGRSTAGAILAIAMHQHAVILDGNVKRVLARYHQLEGWPGKADILREFWRTADAHTPVVRIADYTQAIMDLGATLCTRNQPACETCPLQSNCQAYINNRTADLPQRKQKQQLPVKSTRMLIFELPGGEIQLEKRPAQGVWGGLWSLPEAESEQIVCSKLHAMGISSDLLQTGIPMPSFRHTFSHFHLDIQPIHVKLTHQPDTIEESSRTIWYDPKNPLELGMATPVKRLLKQLRGEQ